MGGYSSFPICIAGFLLRIPIIIYENNLIIGRANKFLLPIVKKIMLSTKILQVLTQNITKSYLFAVIY